MDNNFQTSFIPKKPLAEDRIAPRRNVSIFGFLATLVFIGAVVAAGGAYLYKTTLDKNIASMKMQFESATNAFELSLINELQRLDRRIGSANELLENHVAVSPIFTALQANTLKSIQFTKFSYSTPKEAGAPITVKMSGRARDYSQIALESDQLATNRDIHNAIFSNLQLDDRTGLVGFDLTFTVDSSLVNYGNNLANAPKPTTQATMQGSQSQTPPPTTE